MLGEKKKRKKEELLGPYFFPRAGHTLLAGYATWDFHCC
jgi:hypothetical protein